VTVVVGTAGHIDHGKTALLRALTGIDADRLPEEQRRGMTIDVGYAHLMLPDGGEVDFVDVPGHDRLVGNMLVGAGEIDAVMLVVAADDGARAQTLEHLGLLDALGVRIGLGVVTKVDVVDEARVAEVVDALAGLLARTSLAGAEVHAVSAVTGEGIAGLRVALERVRERAQSETGGRLGSHRLAVDRAFAVRGRGAVVTGTLRGADLPLGAVFRLLPHGGSVRVRGIQVHGEERPVAHQGRAALNLAGVGLAALHRGMVLTDSPDVVATDRLLVAIQPPAGLLDAVAAGDASGWPPPDRALLRLHIGTDQVPAAFGRHGRDGIVLEHGRVVATLRLGRPVAAAMGDRFVLRRPSPATLLGGGVVLDAQPARGPSRRRQTSRRVEALATAVEQGSVAAIAQARLELHGAVATGHTGQAGAAGGTLTVAPDVAALLTATTLDTVARQHATNPTQPGMPLALLRPLLVRTLRRTVTLDPDAATAAVSSTLDAVITAGALVREADLVRLPEHRPPVRDPALLGAMDRLEAALSTLAPSSLAAAARASGCPAEGIRLLERDGRIVLLETDLAYASSTYHALAASALAMAQTEALTPAAYRDATRTSRKYALAILEDLDRRGILRRTPDGHLPGPKAPPRAAAPAAPPGAKL
jgi:selenocysteine-specific elongation factor